MNLLKSTYSSAIGLNGLIAIYINVEIFTKL